MVPTGELPSPCDVAPWLRPDLLPPNPLGPEWGALRDGKVEPMPVEDMLADFRKGPGAERWNGKTERSLVSFVAEPGKERILPVAESTPFRAVILELDEQTLSAARSKHAWAFVLLAAGTGLAGRRPGP